MFRAAATLACTLALGGCATQLQPVDAQPSAAFMEPQLTKLGRLIDAEHAARGESALRLLYSGTAAFAARVALIREAERAIDAQYYIIHGDLTGKLLLGELLAAADRGVRVRLLVDDIYAGGAEQAIADFDHHPQVEVRLFNPWRSRGSAVARMWESVTAFSRINHRMHNKLLSADGAAVVLGGRNLGDEYFDADDRTGFRDLDVVGIGPVAAQASVSFDEFWNSETSIPIIADPDHRGSDAGLTALRESFAAHLKSAMDTPYIKVLQENVLNHANTDPQVNWAYAPTRVLSDSPAKAISAEHERLVDQIAKVVPEAQKEVLVVSPYFVPAEDGVKALRQLAARDVTVKILTNSLASNDVSAVHSGYAKVREPLLEKGVKLYELKRVGTPPSDEDDAAFSSAAASLHAKSFLVDRRHLFVGSLNLDPRSIVINTEVGVLIESVQLAEQWEKAFQLVTSPAFAYEVTVEKQGESEYLIWRTTGADGMQVTLYKEPDTTWLQRFQVDMLKWLPFIDTQI
jgi:cardiolipin synthase C